MPNVLVRPDVAHTAAIVRSRPAAEAERTDLPGLERVTEQTWASISMYSLMGVVPAALLAGLFAWREMLRELLRSEDGGPRLWFALGMGAVGILSLIGWIVARLGRGDFAWETDPEGIEARGLFRRRRLRWTEITAATQTELGYCHLDGPGGRISFASARLAGSAWQHLRRLDRHRSFRVSPAAESLWADNPPVELPLTWTYRGRMPLRIDTPSALGLACIWLALLAIALLSKDGWETPETVVALLCLVGAGFVWRRSRLVSRNCVRRCEVTSAGLRGETWLGPFVLGWEEIERVTWDVVGEHKEVLRICGGSRKQEIFFPIVGGRREIAPLLYTVLRRLRYAERPQALPLPYWLLQPNQPEEEPRT